ncbi:hypothetical protein PENTCL1PPCAC_16093, partial [Pristionchus entomophagus]
ARLRPSASKWRRQLGRFRDDFFRFGMICKHQMRWRDATPKILVICGILAVVRTFLMTSLAVHLPHQWLHHPTA